MHNPQFTVKTESSKDNFSRFVIEPLPQGFGDTLGNSLRRVLYTTIQGAAITAVKIEGVNHQFTTLEGMREDIVQLILALKQVKVAYQGDKPVKITLEASGPAEVKAESFQTPPEVTIINSDLVIATLADKNAKLELEATVESGFGYSPAEDRKSTTLGLIPVDATFTPIVRVNYKVEATRVGRVTDFDKLILEVLTDGSVAPLPALTSAAQTLVNYFNGIVNPQTNEDPKGSSAFQSRPTAGSNISVEELDLPTRIANALQKAGFQTLADVLAVPRTQLSKVKNLGGKSVDIIVDALKVRGFELAQ
ncbi:DNA-directed RNA polymerase subunit alpha [Candidatus Amesbacteria bacterium RIFOXYB1_FULL_44_23]|uniref:DNA-directed RNA polymerase subunit alpha n=1 Tax=Candidatus Amesbacteria bacterium RIFOXYB1_FULL_44_23 TaxID=1797263 RepID=A0A1F4ZUW1_9BACT|nr:MAG: DNA-directed RNA polymerase subunit alpha [Candidatus Amesbacteria bacterium RIFOXYB1_FULL_44_23]